MNALFYLMIVFPNQVSTGMPLTSIFQITENASLSNIVRVEVKCLFCECTNITCQHQGSNYKALRIMWVEAWESHCQRDRYWSLLLLLRYPAPFLFLRRMTHLRYVRLLQRDHLPTFLCVAHRQDLWQWKDQWRKRIWISNPYAI